MSVKTKRMGWCNSNYSFIYMEVGNCGRASNGEVFVKSAGDVTYKKMIKRNLFSTCRIVENALGVLVLRF
jgi:hypothetical protein